MHCPHAAISYQRRCDDCGRMVKGGLTKTDIIFFFVLGMVFGSVLIIYAYSL